MSGRTVELTVLCEGHTEARFAVDVLKPHLQGRRSFACRFARLTNPCSVSLASQT